MYNSPVLYSVEGFDMAFIEPMHCNNSNYLLTSMLLTIEYWLQISYWLLTCQIAINIPYNIPYKLIWKFVFYLYIWYTYLHRQVPFMRIMTFYNPEKPSVNYYVWTSTPYIRQIFFFFHIYMFSWEGLQKVYRVSTHVIPPWCVCTCTFSVCGILWSRWGVRSTNRISPTWTDFIFK